MKKSNLLFTLFTIASFAASAQLCYSPVTNYLAGTNPRSIASADFNGDGKMDLATANYQNNSISILQGDGVGGFFALSVHSVYNNPTCIISADFNGDGKMDLVTGNYGSKNISILLGNGAGSFSAPTTFAVANFVFSITHADYNGDGNLDIATANDISNNVSILLGNGLGSFATATNFAVGGVPNSIVSSDFNGDGKIDLATSNSNTYTVSILLGNGLGSFATANNFTGGGQSIVSADFNGDGKMDLASAYTGANDLSILLGNGLGAMGTPTSFPTSTGPQFITCADFNGDGKKDLITANNNLSNLSILTGNGLGSFSTAINFVVGQNPRSIVCADFNGDGKIDIATANSNGNNASVLLGLITFSVSKTAVTCNGGNDGTASVVVNCGTSLSYSWNTTPVQTTQTATAMPAGTYTVTVNEGSGIKTASVTILQPPAISIGIIKVEGTCQQGYSNGFATATPTGGNPPYYYSWNTTPSQNTATASNLLIGTYTVTVSDSKGCSKTATVTFTLPPPISISITKTNSTCDHLLGGFGNGNGTATANVTGGAAPYTYSWNTSPVQTTATISFLPAGNYTVTVSDFKNCTSTSNVTITAPPAMTTIDSQTNVSCFGGSNGSATIAVSGGVPPYTYLWNTTPAQTTTTVNNLSAGNYTPTITDAVGCTAFPGTSFTILEPYLLTLYPEITVTIPNTNCSGVCNGQAYFSPVGGTAPYTFVWNAAANNQTTMVATQLCQGIYSTTVTDTNGCTATNTMSVGFVPSTDPNIFLTNLAAVDQVNVSPAFTAYYTYSLPPTIVPPASNPRNFVDPGKKARFKVECRNQKTNGQSVVSGICKVRTNSPYITITDSSSILNNIAWNNSVWSADEFEIDINPTTPAGSNAYIDFIVQESGMDYRTTCISIPITPLVYTSTSPVTIDDDNNPDSQGNNNDMCEPNETIEFYPWLNNISTLDAKYVRGSFENLDNLPYINIWNNVPGAGVGVTVYDETWWNWGFGLPQAINAADIDTKPEFDFVFDYNKTNTVNNFKLYMVMAGGFKLFSGTALSLVQWTIPYTFNNAGSISVGDELNLNDDFIIYPNPTNGTIHFSINNATIRKVSVYNALGVLVYESEKNTTTIDLTNYSKGAYFIRAQSEDKVFTKNFIVQ